MSLARCKHCQTALQLYTTILSVAYWCRGCKRAIESWRALPL